MQTKVEIDAELLSKALEVSHSGDATALIEKQLRNLVRQMEAQRRLLELRGKIEWDGDLDAMRREK
ncbi:MAG: type II toxin-antitoxin system VapB family antitoxin [Fulvimarina manganoxydans]|uniref:type II toxin-antitoxin system VapB family antitoxin n=1 Tax=Fulvimarina manganoxydans TaxID=937218 RepID=UPI0023570607|nr:type II toxin-antitoxin system VapB family antitoxin [Fulvimarina manganoxydans]MCK5930751.1 type II toxin-antitoxin system VapB family antitoxin [Fulvimarina manganoxydans]